MGSDEGDYNRTLQIHPKNNTLRIHLGIRSSVCSVQSGQVGETTERQTGWKKRSTAILAMSQHASAYRTHVYISTCVLCAVIRGMNSQAGYGSF